MIELLTVGEKRLKDLKEQMDLEERYSEEWFQLKEKYTKLFQRIEGGRKNGRTNP